MERMDLKVTYRCNNRCLHCVAEGNREAVSKRGERDRTTADCVEQIVRGIGRGAREIVLTGGEPTLRPDLREILESCEKQGLFIHFQTNGRRFSDEAFVSGVRDIQRIVFIVPLHGATRSCHEGITRCANSFQETVRGIRNLVGIGKQVVGRVVMSLPNLAELVNLISVFADLGVTKVNYAFPNIEGGMKKRFAEMVPRYADIQDAVVRVMQAGEETGVYVDFESVPFCIIPSFPDRVSDLQYLLNVIRTIVHLDTAPQNWDEVRRGMKCRMKRCGECVYEHICEGTWTRYCEVFGEEEFTPITSFDSELIGSLLARAAEIEAGHRAMVGAPPDGAGRW